MKVQIDGHDYVVTSGPHGFSVTADDSPSDHFHRSYLVVVRDDVPTGCSCPSRSYRGGVCKHMRIVSNLLRPSPKEASR